jgi:hypothetical protein
LTGKLLETSIEDKIGLNHFSQCERRVVESKPSFFTSELDYHYRPKTYRSPFTEVPK